MMWSWCELCFSLRSPKKKKISVFITSLKASLANAALMSSFLYFALRPCMRASFHAGLSPQNISLPAFCLDKRKIYDLLSGESRQLLFMFWGFHLLHLLTQFNLNSIHLHHLFPNQIVLTHPIFSDLFFFFFLNLILLNNFAWKALKKKNLKHAFLSLLFQLHVLDHSTARFLLAPKSNVLFCFHRRWQ